MWYRVALVSTDVSEECITSIIRVLETALTVIATEAVFPCSVLQLLVISNVPSLLILFTSMMEAIHSCETSVLTRSYHEILISYEAPTL
jgi:hypothetical protein